MQTGSDKLQLQSTSHNVLAMQYMHEVKHTKYTLYTTMVNTCCLASSINDIKYTFLETM